MGYQHLAGLTIVRFTSIWYEYSETKHHRIALKKVNENSILHSESTRPYPTNGSPTSTTPDQDVSGLLWNEDQYAKSYPMSSEVQVCVCVCVCVGVCPYRGTILSCFTRVTFNLHVSDSYMCPLVPTAYPCGKIIMTTSDPEIKWPVPHYQHPTLVHSWLINVFMVSFLNNLSLSINRQWSMTRSKKLRKRENTEWTLTIKTRLYTCNWITIGQVERRTDS